MNRQVIDGLGLPAAPMVIEQRPGSRPVLFLHGFSFDRRLWYQLSALLPASYRLLLGDLPGFGESPLPSAPCPPTDTVVAALDALGIDEPLDVVGHSYGGEVALGLALCAPRRVASLTLIGSGVTGFPTPPEWSTHMDRVKTAVAEGGAEAGLAAWRSHPNFGVPGSVLHHDLVTLTDRYTGWHWTRPELTASLTPTISRLDEIRVPTLILVGEHDTDQARQMAAALASGITDSCLVTLPGVGHVPPAEDPNRVADELVAFLSSTSPPGAVANRQSQSHPFEP